MPSRKSWYSDVSGLKVSAIRITPCAALGVGGLVHGGVFWSGGKWELGSGKRWRAIALITSPSSTCLFGALILYCVYGIENCNGSIVKGIVVGSAKSPRRAEMDKLLSIAQRNIENTPDDYDGLELIHAQLVKKNDCTFSVQFRMLGFLCGQTVFTVKPAPTHPSSPRNCPITFGSLA
jgi:hypothetical protein